VCGEEDVKCVCFWNDVNCGLIVTGGRGAVIEVFKRGLMK